jgi:hypothetical protein
VSQWTHATWKPLSALIDGELADPIVLDEALRDP